jgi:hypothetical protein
MAARLCAFSLVATLVAGTALAADHPIPGKVTVIKAAKLAKFVSKNKPILPALFPTPAPGSLADPTLHGAELRFFDTRLNGAGEFVHGLPANGWTGLGNPPGSQGYKYLGSSAGDPLCKIALIKGKVIKATCKSPAIPLDPPFAGMDGGNAGIILGVPSGSTAAAIRYCVEFGGTAKKNDTNTFKRKDAVAPADCPEIEATPTPTSTPTSTSTATNTPLQACGNNVREGTEDCDGTDSTACPQDCRVDCTCAPPCPSGGGDSTVCYWIGLVQESSCFDCCSQNPACFSACGAAVFFSCDDPELNDDCSAAANAAACSAECCSFP